MARTTALKVLEILPEDTNMTANTIDPYIEVATDMVDDLDSDTSLGTARLALIEMWLTAHLIAMTRERQTVEEEVGEARAKFGGSFGMNLQATTYGQTAAMLDTSGTLAQLGKKKISIYAITSFDS